MAKLNKYPASTNIEDRTGMPGPVGPLTILKRDKSKIQVQAPVPNEDTKADYASTVEERLRRQILEMQNDSHGRI